MVANLESLIKFRKHTVDEKQRILAALYREAEELEAAQQAVRAQMIEERKITDELGTPDAASAYNLYAEGARRKIADLQVKLDKMQIRLEAAQEAMREAFAEMKKIEITDNNRKKVANKAQQKKEDQALDDVAIEIYNRKKDE